MKSRATPEKRPYRQGARAIAAEQTAERIMDALEARLLHDWYNAITLEEIARAADVTVPTVIRRFGGKEGLLEATWQRMGEGFMTLRASNPGDPAAAVRAICNGYERYGDLVWRALAQEERYPVLKPMNDMGRREHRSWIEKSFAPLLEGASAAERRRKVDGLVAALDLFTWKLLRRDMGRSPAQAQRVMLDLVGGVLGADAAVAMEKSQ